MATVNQVPTLIDLFQNTWKINFSNMNKISQDKCLHNKWTIVTPSRGDRSGISECKLCGLWLTHAERLNWESLKNQKTISVVSLVLSMIAIIVSIISLYFKN